MSVTAVHSITITPTEILIGGDAGAYVMTGSVFGRLWSDGKPATMGEVVNDFLAGVVTTADLELYADADSRLAIRTANFRKA